MNTIIAAAGLALGMLGLLQILIIRYLQKGARYFFVSIFGVVSLYSLCILFREIARVHTGYIWAVISRETLFAQAILSSVLPLIVMAFLLYQSKSTWIPKAPLLIWIIYFLLLIYNRFSGIIYRVDDDNNYSRGELFALLMLPPLLIMIINLLLLFKNKQKLTKKQAIAYLIYDIIPLVSVILQIQSHGLQLIVIGTVIAALVMFAFMVSDQQDLYHRKELENAKLKTDVMLAQIHPHFLANSLTTIRYLCHEDPKKAEEAIRQFSLYLRDHMDSITIDSPIPFANELKLSQEYLSLQKLRFGDDLTVLYDLSYKDFSLPTLTLQPIVENAVTHGIRRSRTGRGTVSILSKKVNDHVELIVEDDGDGFDVDAPASSDGYLDKRSHNGIRNVRERLRMVSNGELLIKSTIGEGTKVTIIIPV